MSKQKKSTKKSKTPKLAENSKDYKILYLSNSPFAPSGYGVQCDGNCYEWNKHYDVRVLSIYGVQGAMLGLNGLMIYPNLPGDDHGNRTADLIFKQSSWKPDLFVTLFDIWMGAYIREVAGQVHPIHEKWVPIIMVDHDPVPEHTVISARVAHHCVSPTKWGVEQLKTHGVDPDRVSYIPFGIDTKKTWVPVKNKKERELGKAELGKRAIPFSLSKQTSIDEDSFLIHINSANKDPYRKAFMRMFTAIQIFLEQNPDAVSDTRVYVHSWMKMARDIPHGAKVLGIEGICRGTADIHNLSGVPTHRMAQIARSADVFLHLSEGGGFEIPLLEAMASQTPVICNRFVANPEVVGDGAWLIDPLKSETGAIGKYFTSLDATQCIADEFMAADALEEAYNKDSKRRNIGKRGRKKSLEYDWTKVHPQWYSLIESIRGENPYIPLERREL